MWAAKHLYRVSLVFLLLVVRWGGADISEGGAVNPEGGAVNPEGGAVNPVGGAVNQLGGEAQEDQEFNEVSFGCFSNFLLFSKPNIFPLFAGSR